MEENSIRNLKGTINNSNNINYIILSLLFIIIICVVMFFIFFINSIFSFNYNYEENIRSDRSESHCIQRCKEIMGERFPYIEVLYHPTGNNNFPFKKESTCTCVGVPILDGIIWAW